MDKKKLKGKITKIVGPVIDVSFEERSFLPKIYDALTVNLSKKKQNSIRSSTTYWRI